MNLVSIIVSKSVRKLGWLAFDDEGRSELGLGPCGSVYRCDRRGTKIPIRYQRRKVATSPRLHSDEILQH